MRREARFIAEFRRGVPKGTFFYKIPDLPVFKGSRLRFFGRRPFDAFMIHGGRTFALEFKQFEGLTLPFSILSREQERALLEAERAGAFSLVLVNYRKRGRRNRCVAFPIRIFRELRRRHGKGLPYGAWDGALEIRRGRGSWKVNDFVKRVRKVNDFLKWVRREKCRTVG